jgi:carboxylesterase type B
MTADVDVEQGDLVGTHGDDLYRFLGVPYAEARVGICAGALRRRPPNGQGTKILRSLRVSGNVAVESTQVLATAGAPIRNPCEHV